MFYFDLNAVSFDCLSLLRLRLSISLFKWY